MLPDVSSGCHWVQGLPRNGHPETVAVYAVLLTSMGSLISWAVSLTAACVMHATAACITMCAGPHNLTATDNGS